MILILNMFFFFYRGEFSDQSHYGSAGEQQARGTQLMYGEQQQARGTQLMNGEQQARSR